MHMGIRPCWSFKQIVSSKLFKTKKYQADKKLWLPLPPTFKKPSSETLNTAYITNAPAMSQLIFKPKRSELSPQSTLSPQSRTFSGGKGVKRICQPSHSPNTARQTFFHFWELKIDLADLLLSQGGLMTNLEAVVWTSLKKESAVAFWCWMDRLRKVRLTWLGQGSKKSQNGQVFKMICIEVISPCYFILNTPCVWHGLRR
jgi:hypothetical protein